jgi:alkylated DNA repair protein alkB family protein 1
LADILRLCCGADDSLGHAAIFLLGSTTRETAPTPIVLRSGDVLIMSGPGRQAYHGKSSFLLISHVVLAMGYELMEGVPRIMEGTLPSHFGIHEEDSEVVKAVKGMPVRFSLLVSRGHNVKVYEYYT